MSENIIIIQDLLDTRIRKEKELAFYQEELKKLTEKMHWISMEIKLTTDIINLIEKEKMLDIKQWIEKNNDSKNS